MKTFYLITTFDLIGKLLYTYQKVESETIEEVKRQYKNPRIFVDVNPKGLNIEEEKFFDYRADVTEDVYVSSLLKSKGFKPKTYKNCILMTEKNGGYLQFYHEETEQILKIALNSHYYTPIK